MERIALCLTACNGSQSRRLRFKYFEALPLVLVAFCVSSRTVGRCITDAQAFTSF